MKLFTRSCFVPAVAALCLAVTGCDGHSHDHAGGHDDHDHAHGDHDHGDHAGHAHELIEVDAEALETVVKNNAGRVTVVDYWATWCAPCVAMFNPLGEALKARGPGVRKLSVSLDGPERKDAAYNQLEAFGPHALHDAYIITDPKQQAASLERLAGEALDIAPPIVLVFDQQNELLGVYRDMDPADIIAAVGAAVDQALGDAAAEPAPATGPAS